MKISHVKQDDNCPTHLLAQYFKYLNSYETWIEENSNTVESALTHDVLCLSSS